MKKIQLILAVMTIVLTVGCSKKMDCGCAPPPPGAGGDWKITAISGGITGGGKPLNEAQQYSVLSLRSTGKYVLTNQQTGSVLNGSYTFVANYASIYGEKTKLFFSPQLPILNGEYSVIIDSNNDHLVLGDDYHDGYMTTLVKVQP